jgi:TctA family transporter
MNKYRLLEIAEYISIFAALAGSTIAVTTGQIIYATVPMALALLLSLVGRSQFEGQLQQQFNVSHAEIYQQIADDIHSIKTAVSEIDSQNNSDNTSDLINHYQNLQETLNSLVYRMLADRVLSSYEAGSYDQGIANIISAYRNYKEEYKKSYSAMFPEDNENFENGE